MNLSESQAQHIVNAVKELAMVGIEALAKAVLPVETENIEPEENEKRDEQQDKSDNK